jgi:hypothetical protein
MDAKLGVISSKIDEVVRLLEELSDELDSQATTSRPGPLSLSSSGHQQGTLTDKKNKLREISTFFKSRTGGAKDKETRKQTEHRPRRDSLTTSTTTTGQSNNAQAVLPVHHRPRPQSLNLSASTEMDPAELLKLQDPTMPAHERLALLRELASRKSSLAPAVQLALEQGDADLAQPAPEPITSQRMSRSSTIAAPGSAGAPANLEATGALSESRDSRHQHHKPDHDRDTSHGRAHGHHHGKHRKLSRAASLPSHRSGIPAFDLATIAQLTMLDLTAHAIRPQNLINLASFLAPAATTASQPWLSALQVLILDRNPIGPAGASVLCQALTRHPSLIWLSLEATEIGPLGASSVAQLLASNHHLRVLSLNRNTLGWGVGCIAQAVMAHPHLLTLGLEQTEPSAAALEYLRRLLAANTSLLLLGFDGNLVGPAGCELLAGALATNTHLLFLSLDGCGAGPDGAVAMANALEQNKTLLGLGFGQNHIGALGSAALARSLLVNHQLLLLSVDGNDIPAAYDLVHGLSAHPALQNLYYSNNPFLDVEPAISDGIQEVLDRNRTKVIQVTVPVVNISEAEQVLLGGPGNPLPAGFLGALFPRATSPNLTFQLTTRS